MVPGAAALLAALLHGACSVQLLATTERDGRTGSSSSRLWSFVDVIRRKAGEGPDTAGDRRKHVDVFIGSGGHGHTFPGATMPWGMVQVTPWTHASSVDTWDTQSGYSAKAQDPDFYGMAHSALSGAGTGEMGELRVLPLLPGNGTSMVLLSQTAEASPGYYAAAVRPSAAAASGPSVLVRSSAARRGAVHRFEFPDAGPRLVSLNLAAVPGNFFGYELFDYKTEAVSDRRFEGCALSGVTGLGGAVSHLCFVLEFDQAFAKPDAGRQPTETFAFGAGGSRILTARLAVSRTDLAHARTAFDQEVSGKTLEHVQKEARSAWNEALGRVRVKMSSPSRKRVLYTALYHSMISPNLLSDADGSYRLQSAPPGSFPRRGPSAIHFGDLEEKFPVRRAREGTGMYHTFSVWDTYRSLHPLMNLIHPEVSQHFGESLLAFYDAWGYLPCWQTLASPSDMMEGDGGSIILTTMALNGLVDKRRVLEALSAVRTQKVADKRQCLGAQECLQDKISDVLEQAKADRCVSRLAGHLGQTSVADRFKNRSMAAFQAWDEDQGIFAPIRKANPEMKKLAREMHMEVVGAGEYRIRENEQIDLAAAASAASLGDQQAESEHVHFDNIEEVNKDYKEGSPLQYSWSAEFDLPKMIELRRGEEGFACALDNFFYQRKSQTGVVDMTGSFGALSLGNEPTMHVPYLYSLAGHPSRTQELVGKLMDSFFTDRADGLPGNDDLGQMSSWAIFTMLGIYPVDPCSGGYALGRPFVDEAELTLRDGLNLRIKVNNQSEKNAYVRRLRWNSKDLDATLPALSFDMVHGGGLLEFWMAAEPAGGRSLNCSRSGGASPNEPQHAVSFLGIK